MRLLLLFLFLAYPMLELALLIKVGSAIGLWLLIGLIFLTAAAGVLVLRRQGLTFLSRMSAAMAEGRPPVAAVFDSALVGTAGMLLIAPGLITDVLGAVLLLPPARQMIMRWASRFSELPGHDRFAQPASRPGDAGTDEREAARHPGDGRFDKGRHERRTPIVIEGEYERIDERTVEPKKTGSGPGDKDQPR
jgi:UPF0716 protein FxsA